MKKALLAALLAAAVIALPACGTGTEQSTTTADATNDSETTTSAFPCPVCGLIDDCECTLPDIAETAPPHHASDKKDLDPILVKAIKEHYLAYLTEHQLISSPVAVDDLIVTDWYGQVDNVYLLRMGGDGRVYAQSKRIEKIDKYTFTFPTSLPLYLYDGTSFYTIAEAYRAGVIDSDCVRKIGETVSADESIDFFYIQPR